MKNLDKKVKEYKPAFYEKCILQLIISMSEKNKKFFQTNDTLATVFELTSQSISSMISRLVKHGYLTKFVSEGKRYLEYTGKEFKKIPFVVNYSKLNVIYNKNQCKKYKDECLSLKSENQTLKEKIKELEGQLKK